ncbi:MAG: outer membrane protein transport protein [Bacteroides sp.]|nr:outer membrane protein transport protein [Bacteroides sp.]MCM1448054.1 outer membrane protein transport protein [Bacteroides sp.]
MSNLKTTIALSVMLWLSQTSLVRAQDYLTDGFSANAVLTRDPARQASTEIDAVVTNPAGTAFLSDGMHVSLSGVGKFGSYNGVSVPYKMSNTRITPALQLAYKFKRWTISASYATEGGFGRRSTNEGGVLVQELLAVADYEGENVLDNFRNHFDHMNSALTLIGLLQGADWTPDMDNSLSLSGRFKSKCYNDAIRLGASYRITDYLSVYGGVKVNYAMLKNTSSIRVGVRQASDDTFKTYSEYFGSISDGVANSNMDDENKNSLLGILDAEIAMGETVQSVFDKIANNTISGWGIAPVLGVDVKTKHINFGAKYEFATRIHLNGASDFHVPALLSMGADWKVARKWNVAVGSNIVFIKDKTINAIGTSHMHRPVTWNISSSTTYHLNDKWLFSCGYTYEDFNEAIPDLSAAVGDTYNHRLSIGATYNIMQNLQVNAGVSSQLLDTNNTVVMNDISYLLYKRSPQVQVALGVNYNF